MAIAPREDDIFTYSSFFDNANNELWYWIGVEDRVRFILTLLYIDQCKN